MVFGFPITAIPAIPAIPRDHGDPLPLSPSSPKTKDLAETSPEIAPFWFSAKYQRRAPVRG